MSEDRSGDECVWLNREACPVHGAASETPGPGEGDLRGEVRGERLRAFRDAEHATRRARQAWQKDGGDPCRVRVLGGVADTLAAWADGRGRPDDPAAAWRDAAVEQRTLAEQKVARVEALLDNNDPNSDLAYQHVNHAVDDGDPDCGACWVADLRAALADPEADRGGTT